jgi:pentose-5-phosphate-3-epimerase
MQIIPAILPKNQTELNTKVNQVIGLVSHVQVDICDGVFVSSKTLFDQLPSPEEIEYEVDLMIAEPENTIDDIIEMQPARIIIHLESVKDFQKLFLRLEQVRGIIEIGLAISNDTPNEVLEKYIDDCDFIQLMGIATIGSQGQPFDERVADKITYFHQKYPSFLLS